MFGYYLQLGLRSLRRNPMLTALMIVVIGVGVAASMTTYAVFRATSGDPIPQKSSQLYIAQVDNYGPESPGAEPLRWLTWRDSMALMQARQAKRQTALYPIGVSVLSDDPSKLAYPVRGYAVFTDMFPMFDVPFLYGGPWSAEDDEARARVVVIGKDLNDRVFGGVNSVGREIDLDGTNFRVVGVTARWDARPRFFDLDVQKGFGDLGDLYMPFARSIADQQPTQGGNTCNLPSGPGWDNFIRSECVFVSFWAELPDVASADRYLRFLHDYSNEQRSAGRFRWDPNVRLRNVMEWLSYRRVVPPEARMSLVIASAFLLICLVNTIGLLLAKFMRRAPEIGVRRALGASRRAIYAQFLIEAASVGLAGGLLGIVLTGVGMMGIGLVFDPAIAKLAHMNLSLLLLTVAVALVSTLIAAFYPTWRASQVQPAWQLKSN
ncbi:putative ABC transport system permease protein [Luteibacter rhizovicinus]|uniref:Putative ABC transport system permease protein n=1 Tax=Luteibacter rhizovicinus TaxID=242606 RepID=A0A4R3YP13_9GAMM|nr:ABC transporter permease [Luteibacter rhizovicinus]TCV92894.1 putative ABC transport system permease protein [Luteibacter rhizovicinus]